jgi:hypothetical protein
MLTRLAKEITHLINLSYNDAERRYSNGGMSQRQWMIYCLFWDWSAARFSGGAGLRQEHLYRRRGPEALDRRILRFRSALASN